MLHVKGSDNASAYAFKADNLAGSPLLYVKNDGLVTIGDTTTLYANILGIKKNQSGLLMAELVNTNTGVNSDATFLIGQTGSKIATLRYRNSASLSSPNASTLVLADTFQIESSINGTTEQIQCLTKLDLK
jgi:hypothetical protein